MREQYLIAPRTVTIHKFLDTVKIRRVIHNPELSKGFCSFAFLYDRYGHFGGFNNPEGKICSGENQLKWGGYRCIAFMVAFLGLLIFPRKDAKINIQVTGVVSTLLKQNNSTLAPMIIANIFRALTVCKIGGGFFEGCNVLLQMWMIEHLCHRPQFLKYESSQKTCIEEFSTRVNGFSLLEGVAEWVTLLRSVSANQIEWAFGWLPIDEIIHMSATESHLLLMGLQSIQPYAPYRVLRQLGRYK